MDVSAGNPEAHGLAGLEIHRAIAESSGNTLLRSVTGIVELTLALTLKSLSGSTTSVYFAQSFQAHTALIAAIEIGNAADAQIAMAAIIDLDDTNAMTLA